MLTRMRLFRSNPQDLSLRTRTNLHPLHHLSRRIRVLTTYSVKPEPILACGCTVANEQGCLQSLCSWVAVHKCDTHDRHINDSGVTTQHNPIHATFHPGSSLNLVVFHNSLTKSFHSIAEQQLNLMVTKK